MIKEIVGRIIEAEAKAEQIEADANVKAQELTAQALQEAAALRTNPEAEVKGEVKAILEDAERKAEKLAKEKLAANTAKSVDQKTVEKATKFIVAQFLSGV